MSRSPTHKRRFPGAQRISLLRLDDDVALVVQTKKASLYLLDNEKAILESQDVAVSRDGDAATLCDGMIETSSTSFPTLATSIAYFDGNIIYLRGSSELRRIDLSLNSETIYPIPNSSLIDVNPFDCRYAGNGDTYYFEGSKLFSEAGHRHLKFLSRETSLVSFQNRACIFNLKTLDVEEVPMIFDSFDGKRAFVESDSLFFDGNTFPLPFFDPLSANILIYKYGCVVSWIDAVSNHGNVYFFASYK
jgi:hypothetical protein